jgi:hypothetical protein
LAGILAVSEEMTPMPVFPRPLRRLLRSKPAEQPISPRVRVESLESRQLLSSAYISELLDLTGAALDGNSVMFASTNSMVDSNSSVTRFAAPAAITAAAPILPNVKRNYMGDAFDQKGVKLALVIKIRKQENRGTYASLRGDVRFATPNPIQILFTSITYGKLRSNLHVDFQFSGSNITGTISGKVSSSGSQIKGVYTTSGAYKSSGTFKINKVVGIG